MLESIITTVVNIELASQYKHFEIRIPENVEAITGITLGVRMQTGVSEILRTKYGVIPDSMAIADINLNGGKYNNWFFSDTLMDYIAKDEGVDFDTHTTNALLPFVFGMKPSKAKCYVNLKGTRIKGYCKDWIGENLGTDVLYSLIISLYIKTKDDGIH